MCGTPSTKAVSERTATKGFNLSQIQSYKESIVRVLTSESTSYVSTAQLEPNRHSIAQLGHSASHRLEYGSLQEETVTPSVQRERKDRNLLEYTRYTEDIHLCLEFDHRFTISHDIADCTVDIPAWTTLLDTPSRLSTMFSTSQFDTKWRLTVETNTDVGMV